MKGPRGGRRGGVAASTASAAILLALTLLSCSDLRQRLLKPKFTTVCEVLEQRCRFLNLGDPGEKCVTVELLRTEDGAVLRSLPVCSGPVGTNEEVWGRIAFPADPFVHCMGEDLKGNFKTACGVRVVETGGPT